MHRLYLGFPLFFSILLLSLGCDDEPADGDGDVDSDVDSDVDGDRDADGDVDEDSDADEDADEDLDVEPPDPRWEAFLAARESYLERLAPPIMNCVVQRDTDNAIFHGCYDWHSACHGVFALLALTRLLDDPSYAEIADAELTADNVAHELSILESGSFPEFNNPTGYDELPYGYSWFLTLAAERELGGRDDLSSMANLIADGLQEYVNAPGRGTPDDICVNFHDNISWAVFNLWSHATARGDADLADWAEDYTRTEILDQEARCPVSQANENRREFFPQSLLRAMAIVTVLPTAERDLWIAEHLPMDLEVVPIDADELAGAGAHLAGLNFARAWGLWALYRATNARHFRDLYLDHVEASMEMPGSWDLTSSYSNSHWIAQFGVYAIRLSYDD